MTDVIKWGEQYITISLGINGGFDIVLKTQGSEEWGETITHRNRRDDAWAAAELCAENRGLKVRRW